MATDDVDNVLPEWTDSDQPPPRNNKKHLRRGRFLLTISSVKENGSVTPQVPAAFWDFMTYGRLRALTIKLGEQLPVLVDDFLLFFWLISAPAVEILVSPKEVCKHGTLPVEVISGLKLSLLCAKLTAGTTTITTFEESGTTTIILITGR